MRFCGDRRAARRDGRRLRVCAAGPGELLRVASEVAAMNNLLVAIAVFIITVVGALFAVPYFVDWNSYRSISRRRPRASSAARCRWTATSSCTCCPPPISASRRCASPTPRPTSGAVLQGRQPQHQAVHSADVPRHRGGQRDRVPAPDPAPGARRQGRPGTGRALRRRWARPAYMPSNVTLTSLKIADGVLALHGPDGVERAQARRLERRAVGAGARRALPLPRRVRLGRGRARDQAGDRHARGRRQRAHARVPAPRRYRRHLPARRAPAPT